MNPKIKILAISGSTRQFSVNAAIIRAIARLSLPAWEVLVYDGLATLPHFNPDLLDAVPAEVADFRQQLRDAAAVLICSPEYAAGVPGTLKNAIDWTVSSMEFAQKPLALITAGTSGRIAHRSLLDTLLLIEAKVTAVTQLLIPAVKTKMGADDTITDPETLSAIQALIAGLSDVATGACKEGFLPAPVIMPG